MNCKQQRVITSWRDLLVATVFFFILAAALLYPGAIGGKSVGSEGVLFNAPPLTQDANRLKNLEGANSLMSDPIEVFHPDLQWSRSEIRSGRLPIWNPYISAGYPQLASQQTAAFYPLNALAYVMPFWNSLGWIYLLKLVLAAVGMWLLCSYMGSGRAGAYIAGTSFAFGCYFTDWLLHPHTNVYLLLPWLFLCSEMLIRRRDWRSSFLLASVVGIGFLGGHLQSLFIEAFAVGPFILLRAIQSSEEKREFFKLILKVAAAALLGAMAGSVMTFPFIELIGQSTNYKRGLESGTSMSSLWSIFMPDLWGRSDGGFQGAGPVNFAERTVYIGVIPLLLAVVGMVTWRVKDSLIFLGLLVGSAVLYLDIPFINGLLIKLPVIDQVGMTRAAVIAVFVLSIFAAFGTKALFSGETTMNFRRAIVALSLVVGIPVLWLARHSEVLSLLVSHPLSLLPFGGSEAKSQTELSAQAVMRFGLLSLFFIGVMIYRTKFASARVVVYLAVMLVAVTAVDLVSYNRGFHPATDSETVQPPVQPSIRYAQEHQGHQRSVGADQFLIPNTNVQYGLRDFRAHALPVLRRTFKLHEAYGGQGFQATRFSADKWQSVQELGVFAASYLMTPARSSAPDIDGMREVESGPDERVYFNPGALPRAYFSESWQSVKGEGEARAVLVKSLPEQLCINPVIEGVSPPKNGVKDTNTGRCQRHAVSFLKDESQQVTLKVKAEREGYLVLLDSYYPGWKVVVDGKPSELHAANAAFRAVQLSAGVHTVTFKYQPRSVLWGLILSGIAWLLIVAGLAYTGLNTRHKAKLEV